MHVYELQLYVHVCASVRVIAGNFQVVLIVDNQETTTKSMFRGVLLKELSRYGEHALHLLPPGAGSALHPAQGQPVIASFTPAHRGGRLVCCDTSKDNLAGSETMPCCVLSHSCL